MKRKLIDELIQWKNSNNSGPILLTGVKGVGKTYLAYDFAKAFFKDILYINFEHNQEAIRMFEAWNPDNLSELCLSYVKIDPEISSQERILILDEVSFVGSASLSITNHPMFQSIFPYIILISSKPLSDNRSINIRKLTVYPLEFDEFLRAIGNEWYIETISNHFHSNKKIPEIVHKELLSLHQLYMKIGGMPGIVNEYLNLFSDINISEQHNFLIGSYHDYIKKDNPDSEALKMNQVLDSLALQLMKENKKFQYKLIRKGTTHAMYKDAIRRLTEGNYVIKCNRINTEQLTAFSDDGLSELLQHIDQNTNFKLYFSDTGLLHTKMIEEQRAGIKVKSNKALYENYVAQALQAKNMLFAFWESASMAKLDFVVQKEFGFLPIEVFEGDNTRSKSISVLKQSYDFPYAIKISSRNFDFSNQIKYVPYYAVYCI
ncbi:ATP-binding protein [Lachnospiraceae bacterium MD1]|uniref:ATP-binding protein n=1 Tax=Variimorphobacter saccharofermentans TaxID=2755051 RepID=A0A839K0K9_9FIRM|nr:AAA family ATPase [Variimorphobacter saccharofermentans]MBB2182967.1 ATP-binding protein [Variimorphobacter saccharofermentans]